MQTAPAAMMELKKARWIAGFGSASDLFICNSYYRGAARRLASLLLQLMGSPAAGQSK